MTDTGREIAELTARLEKQLAEKFRFRERPLASALRRAGRRLPRRMRRAGREVVQAAELCAHPKLSKQLDMAQVRRAAAQLEGHLEGVDPAEARKDAILSVLAPLAFNLLLLGAALMALAWWQGWV